MRIFLDIETQPTDNAAAIVEISQKISPPSNYTKTETIQAWWADKGQQAIADAVGQTALDACLGSIISIGFSLDEGVPEVLISNPDEYDEKALLVQFQDRVELALNSYGEEKTCGPETGYVPDPYWVGHNLQFDLNFIWRRMAINGVTPRFWIPSPSNYRHGHGCFCTMIAWAGHRDRISLDRLCKTLGVQSPKQSGMNGAMAHRVWREGDIDTVIEYNRNDVVACREIYRRMEGMRYGN